MVANCSEQFATTLESCLLLPIRLPSPSKLAVDEIPPDVHHPLVIPMWLAVSADKADAHVASRRTMQRFPGLAVHFLVTARVANYAIRDFPHRDWIPAANPSRLIAGYSAIFSGVSRSANGGGNCKCRKCDEYKFLHGNLLAHNGRLS